MKLQKPLRPFFKYYGSKWSLAKHYKKPKSETIIEPFAGSACYSLHHWNKYEVWLNDLDDNIASLWSYLIKVKESEIKSLPLLKQGQSVDDLDVCKEAKILMGFWLGFACSTPRKTESPHQPESRQRIHCSASLGPTLQNGASSISCRRSDIGR